MEISVNDILRKVWELDGIIFPMLNQKDFEEKLEVIFSREGHFQDVIVKIQLFMDVMPKERMRRYKHL